jgi:DNA invertase Pin-like site-specific DNA recombinase
MAEDERQRILARCNAGRQVAKTKGVRFGSKPKLTHFRLISSARH